jgi:hypothetical protein
MVDPFACNESAIRGREIFEDERLPLLGQPAMPAGHGWAIDPNVTAG